MWNNDNRRRDELQATQRRLDEERRKNEWKANRLIADERARETEARFEKIKQDIEEMSNSQYRGMRIIEPEQAAAQAPSKTQLSAGISDMFKQVIASRQAVQAPSQAQLPAGIPDIFKQASQTTPQPKGWRGLSDTELSNFFRK